MVEQLEAKLFAKMDKQFDELKSSIKTTNKAETGVGNLGGKFTGGIADSTENVFGALQGVTMNSNKDEKSTSKKSFFKRGKSKVKKS